LSGVEKYVLAAGLLFVVVTGLILRFFNWIARRRRTKRAAAIEAAAKANRLAEKPASATAPSSAPAKTSPPPLATTPAPVAAQPAPSAKPSAAATVAPGAALRPPSPPAPKFAADRLPLPAGVEAPNLATTIQPRGAEWTPPPQTIRAAEAANPPPAPAVKLSPDVALGPLELSAPSVAGTLYPTEQSSHIPQPSTDEDATVADDLVKPSASATLAPGSMPRTAPPPAPAIPDERLPLPEGAEAPNVASTVQPAGANWTAPPQIIRAAEAANPPPPPQPPLQTAALGPLEITRPSVAHTLFSASGPVQSQMAAEIISAPAQQSGHPLSAAPAHPLPSFKMTNQRPAPTPRPGPPPWAIVALKTSLPFRVRRPDTRLVGKTAKEVVFISKARQATRVIGQSLASRLSGVSRRPH
jgi:hypothetical protein